MDRARRSSARDSRAAVRAGLLPLPRQPARERRARTAYPGVFVFDNDHPCVSAARAAATAPPAGHLSQPAARRVSRGSSATARGTTSRSPSWRRRGRSSCCASGRSSTGSSAARAEVDHVLIFENKGEVVGVSNPHPHCQIYATNFVFKTIETEARAGERHLAETGACCSRTSSPPSTRTGGASSARTRAAIAFVPYFARYAYESYVAPKATHPSIAALSTSELRDFAAVLGRSLVRFDNCGRCRFPTSWRCTRRRRTARLQGLPLPHRVPPAAAQAEPAQVPGRSGDRRRQLPQRHGAGGEGCRAARRPAEHYKRVR